MKPIIIDMKDLTDSTEVYDAKPNPVLAGFIYLILIMVVAAGLWMSIFQLDIVVKGTGTVAALDEVVTITNQTAGVIENRFVNDGEFVEKGQVLYTVKQDEIKRQLDTYSTQLLDIQEKEEMLMAYDSWLRHGKEFSDEIKDNLYYTEIASRKQLSELGRESTLQVFNGDMSTYSAKLTANADLKKHYQTAVRKTKQLITDIKNRNNSFSKEDTYYFTKVENYMAQYQNTEKQYNNQVKPLQEEVDLATKKLEKANSTKQNHQIQLEAALQELELSHIEGTITVSGGDTLQVAPNILLVDKQAEVTNLQQKMQTIESEIDTYKAIKDTAEKSIQSFVSQKETALNAYEKENIASLESSILSYEQNILTYDSASIEYENGKAVLHQKGTENEISSIIANEQNVIANEIDICRQTKMQLDQTIADVEESIENATVVAPMTGITNFAEELVNGNYVNAGVQTLSIIPNAENDAFIVKSYIENKDIAKLDEGMKVTYDIAAYPANEYGTVKGQVTFVSADLKVNNGGSAYYVIETNINNTNLSNRVGDKVNLKVGMLCETKIVVESKSVLKILVDKILHR